ncbi:MAG: MFS transporter [Actinomycetes bacterium]
MNAPTGLNHRPLWANRDYVLWWLGNLASSIGDQLVVVAIPLMVLLLTASPLQAGLVSSLEVLPFIILSLPAGVLVDRLPRRPLLIGASLVSLVTYALIPVAHLLGSLTVAHLYAVAFVSGCSTVIFAVAQQTALPTLVDARHLGAAAGQAETVERLAAILGPLAATYLFYQASPTVPFAVNALSFAVIALAVTQIRANLGPFGVAAAQAPRVNLLAGARSLLRNRLLRDLTLLNSTGDMLFAGIGLLMIVLLREGGQQGTSIGVVFSSAAIGGLLGAMATNWLERRLGLATAVIGKHVLTAALFPLLLLGLPVYGVGILWASISFQVSIVAVIQRKYVLLATPADLMGRVQSFTTFLSFGSLPIGAAATGFVLEAAGARGAVVVYTLVLVAMAAWSIASRAIRTGTGSVAVS